MKKLLVFTLQILFLVGCLKEEYKPLDYKGDLAIHIDVQSEFLYDVIAEYSYYKVKADSIEVVVEGANPQIKIYTDTAGNCNIPNLSMGAYNLICSKKGMETLNWPGYRFLGNEYPKKQTLTLYQKSTTKVKSYNIGIVGDSIKLSGIISHRYPPKSPNLIFEYRPQVDIYYSNSPDVNFKNFITKYTVYSDLSNDTIIRANLKINYNLFPHGSNLYTIIYGIPKTTYYDYNPITKKYFWHLLGDPSEVKSVIIP